MKYTVSSPVLSTGISPQPLSRRLQAVWKIIADLAVKEGHAFADTPWWSWRLGCTPQHVNRIFRELVAAGRLIIEKVAGSHDRKFYPIRLPRRPKRFSKCSEDVPETRGTLYSIEPAMQVIQGHVEDPAPVSAPQKEKETKTVKQLVDLGVWPQTAPWLVHTFPERIERAIAYFQAMKRANIPIENDGAYLKSCITEEHGKGLDLAMVGKALPPDPQPKREAVRVPQSSVPITRAPASPHNDREVSPSRFAGMSPLEIRAALQKEKENGRG